MRPTRATPSSHFGIDVFRGVDELRLHAAALGDFDQAIRIRTVGRADDEDEIDVLRNLFDGFLTILCCVADVVAGGALDRREFLAKARDDFLGVVEAQRRLREERKLFGIVDFERVDGVHRIDDDGAIGSFAGGADDFLVIFVADQNNGALFARKLERFEMNFGDEGAGRVDHFEAAILGFLTDRRGHAVGAEDENAPLGTSLMASTKIAPRRRNCSTT